MQKIRASVALGLFVSILSIGLMWPQAQTKPAPSPTPQATAPATTSGSCVADITETVMAFVFIGPLKHRARLFLKGQPRNAGTGVIRSASTEKERVHITME
jgi:hypothetical protein